MTPSCEIYSFIHETRDTFWFSNTVKNHFFGFFWPIQSSQSHVFGKKWRWKWARWQCRVWTSTWNSWRVPWLVHEPIPIWNIGQNGWFGRFNWKGSFMITLCVIICESSNMSHHCLWVTFSESLFMSHYLWVNIHFHEFSKENWGIYRGWRYKLRSLGK